MPRRSLSACFVGALLLSSLTSCASPERPSAKTSVSTVLVPAASVPPRDGAPIVEPVPVAAVDPLADGFAATTTKRALLVRRGPLWLTDGEGPAAEAPLGDTLLYPWEGVVVAEQADSVHMVLELRAVRLVVHADRRALALVPRAPTVLSVAPELPADPAGGVRVAPGVVLIEKAQSGSMLRVQGTSGKVTFEGWAPDDALGAVYDKGEFDAVMGNGLVREGTTVFASPGGATVASFASNAAGKPDFVLYVEPEPGAPPGWQRIRLRTRELDLRGFVAAADYKPKPPGQGRLGGSYRSHGGGGAMSDSRRGILAVGTSLYAPVDHARVGRVLEPLHVYYGLGSQTPGGRVVAQFFAQDLGVMTVEVNATDIGPEAPE